MIDVLIKSYIIYFLVGLVYASIYFIIEGKNIIQYMKDEVYIEEAPVWLIWFDTFSDLILYWPKHLKRYLKC